MPRLTREQADTPGKWIAWGKVHSNMSDFFQKNWKDTPIDDQFVVVRQDYLAQAIDEAIAQAVAKANAPQPSSADGLLKVVQHVQRYLTGRLTFLEKYYPDSKQDAKGELMEIRARFYAWVKEFNVSDLLPEPGAQNGAADPGEAKLVVRPPV